MCRFLPVSAHWRGHKEAKNCTRCFPAKSRSRQVNIFAPLRLGGNTNRPNSRAMFSRKDAKPPSRTFAALRLGGNTNRPNSRAMFSRKDAKPPSRTFAPSRLGGNANCRKKTRVFPQKRQSAKQNLCALAPWRERKASKFRHEFSRKVAKPPSRTFAPLRVGGNVNRPNSNTSFPAKRQSRQGNSLRPRAFAGAQTVKFGNHRPNFARILTARSSPSTFSRILSRRSRSRSLLTARNLVTTSSDSLPR